MQKNRYEWCDRQANMYLHVYDATSLIIYFLFMTRCRIYCCWRVLASQGIWQLYKRQVYGTECVKVVTYVPPSFWQGRDSVFSNCRRSARRAWLTIIKHNPHPRQHCLTNPHPAVRTSSKLIRVVPFKIREGTGEEYPFLLPLLI